MKRAAAAAAAAVAIVLTGCAADVDPGAAVDVTRSTP